VANNVCRPSGRARRIASRGVARISATRTTRQPVRARDRAVLCRSSTSRGTETSSCSAQTVGPAPRPAGVGRPPARGMRRNSHPRQRPGYCPEPPDPPPFRAVPVKVKASSSPFAATYTPVPLSAPVITSTVCVSVAWVSPRCERRQVSSKRCTSIGGGASLDTAVVQVPDSGGVADLKAGEPAMARPQSAGGA
jgi:hypothetical protein